ncbi:TAT-variant-translocated molybdopterin oxidoreductase [Horticoccus luteus]|uniref:TAT-variant-translocated molybdopterin oxidoreductase n=1 Tax=Horticoccus luteus TaxID=2862869 RepID=A0A8F9TXF5_9BACT|nr:TAT-variant-translocated molybdopterin oxidoreductase [Horticoccus luteus]QYM79797.1 TAT-variant-translocated molybdopterin oxidoreductase [Horticoccus luteus]
MKRIVQHPQPSPRELTGPKYWRSLDELANTPGFQEQVAREFPGGAAELNGVDRRQFMKIMAASFALGGIGLAGCRRPEKHILPYGKSVEGVIPGLPLYFATAMPMRGGAIPLLAETHEGRPTKVEGNPSYAPHGGAASAIAQASLLELYDPDRATTHTKGGATLDREAVDALLAKLSTDHAGNAGAGLAFLAEESSSPTRTRLVAALRAKFPQAIWAEYEPVSGEVTSAARTIFGAHVKPLYRFDRADRVVSLDADFLHSEEGSLIYARDFSKKRRVTKKEDAMNRLYMAESGFTITGTMADHRLRLATSHMVGLAAALAGKITGSSDYSGLAQGLTGVPSGWVEECAADLAQHRGRCVVIAGAHLPAAAHALAHAMNAALGNLGQTVELATLAENNASSIQDLARSIKGGAVKTLVILGGNPAYNAPAELGWAALQKSVADVVHFSYYQNETSVLAGTHIAATHYLESWGDARTMEGIIVPIQPMILPLFGGYTEIEVLAKIAGEKETDPHGMVRATFAGVVGEGVDAEKAFHKFLHDGLLEGSAYPISGGGINSAGLKSLTDAAGSPSATTLSQQNLEVRFCADYKVDDGRFANNGWLQELPDPITRICWDNAILVSPHLAKELGILPKGALVQVARIELADSDNGREMAHEAEITLNGRTIRGPLHIQPGLSNYTLILSLGYGRTTTGRVGEGAGTNVYPLRTTEGLHFATGAKVSLTGKRIALANTQEHWSMEGRGIVREANLEEYQENPAFVKEIGMEAETPPVYGQNGAAIPLATKSTTIPRGNSLYKTPEFDGVHQWGMSIDLNTCIGCNACVIACQSENNIPIVGRDQVLRGRQMHWIRIDRYYSDGRADAAAFGGEGNREIPQDPQVSLQPMACVQCELAPCETVCPVNATVHDDEGLNVMAYNRCIGTRYCANNCPYKVRRFNFFDWNQRSLDSLYMGPLGPHGMPELVQMSKNPQVTVRMRGVMEKCTYCVQRIENGKIQHKVKVAQEGNPGDVVVPDGVIKTACQQTCPVGAIVFGNIRDPESAVSKAKAREQDYAVLGYLNTRPRTTYLGKLRNPNPRMPDFQKLPFTRQEQNRKSHPASAGAEGGAHGEGHGEMKKQADHAMLDSAKRLGGVS